MSKTLQEAIENVAIAIGESEKAIKDMVEREFKTKQTLEKLEVVKRRLKRLNTHTKRPQSPYAIFDKFHKKQKRK